MHYVQDKRQCLIQIFTRMNRDGTEAWTILSFTMRRKKILLQICHLFLSSLSLFHFEGYSLAGSSRWCEKGMSGQCSLRKKEKGKISSFPWITCIKYTFGLATVWLIYISWILYNQWHKMYWESISREHYSTSWMFKDVLRANKKFV